VISLKQIQKIGNSIKEIKIDEESQG